ncbi:uncharacterized protein DS421_8g248470 [Arachis hypogaea]|nr:uncharacterized protein DS421_8g248470 [Arachis hypogaea]
MCQKLLHILKIRERTLGCQEKLEGKEQKGEEAQNAMRLSLCFRLLLLNSAEKYSRLCGEGNAS